MQRHQTQKGVGGFWSSVRLQVPEETGSCKKETHLPLRPPCALLPTKTPGSKVRFFLLLFFSGEEGVKRVMAKLPFFVLLNAFSYLSVFFFFFFFNYIGEKQLVRLITTATDLPWQWSLVTLNSYPLTHLTFIWTLIPLICSSIPYTPVTNALFIQIQLLIRARGGKQNGHDSLSLQTDDGHAECYPFLYHCNMPWGVIQMEKHQCDRIPFIVRSPSDTLLASSLLSLRKTKG